MLILDRYFIREVFKFLGIILVTVISIFLAVEFFEKIDDFIEAGVSMQRAAAYFLLRIPYVLALLFPMAIFLSSLIALGLMNKRNELLALRSGEAVEFTVTDISDGIAHLDGNHPLAGQTLVFEVEIQAIRDASSEELTQGKVLD